ncbi:expressed hypothetical protein [Trichoplax adhaerens]|uniref:Carbonic anhydrase n=1 Tax=Trichoplax adhaerens TaxID=10228 RepID=B3RWG7_TRIAD|nr:expressed hypothetical protein [Trichoplax adhaerens]EDV25132.1 expressed hypothetical protein [Trichoplax adhaerens]|eukprot:XP_002113022.1 expressed hypothetical protein [Trichoplax adhaerens]
MLVDPLSWANDFKLCGGKKQSPIDIVTANMIHIPNMSPLVFTGTPSGGCTLINTGHAVQCTLDPTFSYSVTGGPFSYNYRLGQFHVHFGSDATKGSEHRLNGRAFAAEVHFVFYNSDMYLSVADAADNANGLAVIGGLVDLHAKHHNEFDKIANNAQYVKYAGDTHYIANFDVSKLMPHHHYYATYAGSLTTPTCDESVTWVVLNNHIHATDAQLNKLRTQVYTGDAIDPGVLMVNNFRPAQPLNARRVFFN